MLQGLFFTTMLFSTLISSVIGGVFLLLLAKYLGKISKATFGNSFLICLIGSVLYFLAWYLLGFQSVLSMSFMQVLLVNFVFIAIPYILLGKLIWKSSWLESVKANSLWILAYALAMGFILA